MTFPILFSTDASKKYIFCLYYIYFYFFFVKKVSRVIGCEKGNSSNNNMNDKKMAMNDKSINLFHISHPIPASPLLASLSLVYVSLSPRHIHPQRASERNKKKRKLYCLISRCAVFSIVYASITLKHKINAYIKHDREYNFFSSSHVVNLWDFFFVLSFFSCPLTHRLHIA